MTFHRVSGLLYTPSAVVGTSMLRRLLLLLASAPVRSGQFSSRHLVLPGCKPGCLSGTWPELFDVLVATFQFDSAACVADRVEMKSTIDTIIAQAAPLQAEDPLMLVSSAMIPELCCTGTGGHECDIDGSSSYRFLHPYTSAFDAGEAVVNIFLNWNGASAFSGSGANLTQLPVVTLLPNNHDGGVVAARQFCIRAQSSGPQRIAVIRGCYRSAIWEERMDGFEGELGTSCPQHQIVARRGLGCDGSIDLHNATFDVAVNLMLLDTTITTFALSTDEMALGVIDAARLTRARGDSDILLVSVRAAQYGCLGLYRCSQLLDPMASQVSFDNQPEIRRHVASGTVAVTIDWQVTESGTTTAHALHPAPSLGV